MFIVNNKDTKTYFTPFSCVSIVDFEQVNVCWEPLTIYYYKKLNPLSRGWLRPKSKTVYGRPCLGASDLGTHINCSNTKRSWKNTNTSFFIFNIYNSYWVINVVIKTNNKQVNVKMSSLLWMQIVYTMSKTI